MGRLKGLTSPVSYLNTLPKILTALATLIGAITALILILSPPNMPDEEMERTGPPGGGRTTQAH